MERENRNLKVLVIILCVLVLGLGGYFLYDKVLNSNGEKSEVENTENQIDIVILNQLYDTLGINTENEYYGDCLNYFISNNNFQTNSQKIFSLYAAYKKINTYRYNDNRCDSECKMALSCTECTSILKEDGDKIISLYNFNNLTLDQLPGIGTDYVYVSGIPVGTCHYKVSHDISSKYVDEDSILITDNQVVKDYDYTEEENIKTTENQTVTYTFEKDSDGNYYLNNVNVK